MSTTSANINDLKAFVDGSTSRVGRLRTTRADLSSKASTVAAACSFQHPSTHSVLAALELVNAWGENGRFVKNVHDDLVEADNADCDGNATVSNAVVAASLQDAGLTEPPSIVDVPAIELYGQPPYSGFVDDPICLANGNFLLRDGDSADVRHRAGPVGRAHLQLPRRPRRRVRPRLTSMVDVGLVVTEQRLTFRSPDGGGVEFRRLLDGTWESSRRRGLSVESADDGWIVRERHERSWTFDRDGTLVSATARPALVVVDRRPDRVTFTEQRSGRWVTFHLDADARRVRSLEASDGRTVDYGYTDGRLTSVRRDTGDVTYAHDDAGLLVEVVDADGITVCRNTYDGDGRVSTQVEEHGRETSYEYRSDGVSTVTASDGAPPNVMVHDRRGRMTAMIDGLGHVMRVAYDDLDRITQIVDRTGAVTRLRHDDRGNVVERVDADGLRETFAWDDADRLIARTDRAGHRTTFDYVDDGRDPVLVAYPDGSTVEVAYDDAGLPTSVLDADGVRYDIERNRDGLLAALVDGLGHRTTLDHDRTGRPIGVEFPEGIGGRSELDERGRPVVVRTPTGEQHLTYSAAGRPISGTDGAGVPGALERDDSGEVRRVETAGSPRVTYERDTVGRIATVVDAEGGRTAFEYDPVGRQIAVVDPLGNRSEVGLRRRGSRIASTDATGATRRRELDVPGARSPPSTGAVPGPNAPSTRSACRRRSPTTAARPGATTSTNWDGCWPRPIRSAPSRRTATRRPAASPRCAARSGGRSAASTTPPAGSPGSWNPMAPRPSSNAAPTARCAESCATGWPRPTTTTNPGRTRRSPARGARSRAGWRPVGSPSSRGRARAPRSSSTASTGSSPGSSIRPA